jgi:hypothetical protein
VEELAPSSRVPPDVEAASRDPARRFGPFILVKELGRGGSGVVHAAWDTSLKRRIALKVLLACDPEQFERFSREAQAVARLEHPGIIRVLDLAHLNGRPYIAMEYVEGRSLRELFNDQSLRTRQFVSVLRDVAEALGHAHAQGIVHRDVKPGNIVVDATGRGRIMDFGVARDLSGLREELTETGEALGTPEYMSPEQASDARSVSARSDVYSLGVVLFEGLTGRVPFRGATPVETMFKVLSENLVRPSALSEVPLMLESVILRCLDRDPMKRFADARELATALDEFIVLRKKKDAPKAEEPEASDFPVRAAALGFAALCALSVGIAYVVARAQHEHEAQRLAAEAAEKKLQADLAEKAAAERQKAREAALAKALATRGPLERVAELDKLLLEDAKDARALVARAVARELLLEDAIDRRASTSELVAAIDRDVDEALKLEPGSSIPLLVRANAAYELNDLPKMAAALAAASKGKDAEAKVASVLEQNQDRLKAPSEPLAEFVRDAQSATWVWRFYVPLLFGEGRVADAVPVLRAAVEREESPVARERLAACLMAAGDGQGMLQVYKDWLAAWPEAHHPRFFQGCSALRQRNTETAFEEGRWLVEHGDSRGHFLRANALIVLGKTQEALAECEAWEKLPEQPGDGSLKIIPITRAQAYSQDLDVQNAATALVEAAKQPLPRNLSFDAVVGVARELARRLIRERGDDESADAVVDALLLTEARGPELLQLRVQLALNAGDLGAARSFAAEAEASAQGRRLPERDEIDRAWRAFEERVKSALAGAHDPVSARLERAELLMDAGDRIAAAREIDAVLATPEREAQARALVTRARLLDTGTDSATDVDKALELAPDLPLGLAERAIARAVAKDAEAARADADKAVALAPKDALVRARVAEARRLLDDAAGATAEVREALALDPSCITAFVVRFELEQARDDHVAMATALRAIASLQPVAQRAELFRRRAAFLEATKH